MHARSARRMVGRTSAVNRAARLNCTEVRRFRWVEVQFGRSTVTVRVNAKTCDELTWFESTNLALMEVPSGRDQPEIGTVEDGKADRRTADDCGGRTGESGSRSRSKTLSEFQQAAQCDLKAWIARGTESNPRFGFVKNSSKPIGVRPCPTVKVRAMTANGHCCRKAGGTTSGTGAR